MKVPFVDLQAQYKTIESEIQVAINSVINRSSFVLGDDVTKFEEEFARYCGTRFCVGVNNGTSAIFLMVLAAGISAGDEVIIPTNTFIATAEGISMAGAVPVFANVDLNTGLLDPKSVESLIGPRTKAILPVHLYGQMAPMGALLALAQKHNLLLLEDACQAHGSRQDSFNPGHFGLAAAYSFYPGKNLGAYGEGGAIVTNDQDIADRIVLLRDHGSKEKYHHDVVGYNMRMEGIQAAVLRVKLPYLESWNTKRREHANVYMRDLADVKEIQLPTVAQGNQSNFHLFVITTDQREGLMNFLKKRDIATGIHYPIPIHLQKAYENQARIPLLNAEHLAKKIVSLPMYAELTDEQISFIVSSIHDFFRKEDSVKVL